MRIVKKDEMWKIAIFRDDGALQEMAGVEKIVGIEIDGWSFRDRYRMYVSLDTDCDRAFKETVESVIATETNTEARASRLLKLAQTIKDLTGHEPSVSLESDC